MKKLLITLLFAAGLLTAATAALWKTAKASLKRRCLSAGKINGNIEDE